MLPRQARFAEEHTLGSAGQQAVVMFYLAFGEPVRSSFVDPRIVVRISLSSLSDISEMHHQRDEMRV